MLAARRHSKALAVALAVVVVLVAKPFSHVFDLASHFRRSAGRISGASTVEFTGTDRARGALVDPGTHAALGTTQKFLRSSLRPDETFFDFASVGFLYYVFNRDCPIRYPEVATYEREEAQREVISALEKNRKVRAVLTAFPTALSEIDGVPNRDRAPLVWAYIQERFTPALEENGVVFWTRR